MLPIGGLELISPILYVFPKSSWRSDVTATWNFFEKEYNIKDYLGKSDNGTHIHISLQPAFDLQDLKRLASSIIHFEPAFEALMPEHRRGNAHAISNFLGSPHLQRQGRSRSESIVDIERTTDIPSLFRLIQGYKSNSFSWNFHSLFEPKHTIEFRQPPAATTLAESLSWAELTLNFVQASLQEGQSSRLRNFHPTVRGLRSFLEQENVRVPEVNEPAWLDRIWATTRMGASVEPKAVNGEVFEHLQVYEMKRTRSRPKRVH
jgi:Putative amidoligase enzyme